MNQPASLEKCPGAKNAVCGADIGVPGIRYSSLVTCVEDTFVRGYSLNNQVIETLLIEGFLRTQCLRVAPAGERDSTICF